MSSSECGVVAGRGWTGGIALTVDVAAAPKCDEADEENLYRSPNNMTESCLTAAPSTPMTSSTLSTQSAPGSGSAALVRRGRASPAPVNRVPLVRQSEERRAKRCRFYRNGDRWFPGTVVAVSSDRHRTWDSLLMDLTRLLEHPLHLAAGVRFVFTLEGTKIEMLDQLTNSGEYVASSSDAFKSIDYRAAQLPQWRLHTKRREALHVPSAQTTSRSSPHEDHTIRPRLVTVLRNGQRPRRAVRVLLNRRTARALDQVMEDLSASLKLDSGAVRKIYTLDGRQVCSLKELFQGDDVFIACGHERCSRDDFHLDSEESRAVLPLLKGPGLPGLRRRMPSPKPRGRAISPMPISDHSGSLPRGSRLGRGEEGGGQRPPSSPHISCSSSEDLFLPASISSRYRVGRVLGDGNFAVVRECRELAPPKRKFALKIIDKSKCEGKEDMIQSEVDILRKVRHENIVRLEEEVHCPDYLYLVMELVTGGDLFDAIAAATHYTESQAGHLVRDLASALQYLHHRNVVHRDVKPENLLVVPGPMPRLKLGDFGLAVQLTEPLYTICGTPTYVAPEILAEQGYGLEVDIWAAGVIAYILLCGFPPFISASNNQEELFEQILAGHLSFPSPYWDHVTPHPRHLIAAMVLVDPAARFTADQVLEHPWLREECDGTEPDFSGYPTSEFHQQSAAYQFSSLTAPPPTAEGEEYSGYSSDDIRATSGDDGPGDSDGFEDGGDEQNYGKTSFNHVNDDQFTDGDRFCDNEDDDDTSDVENEDQFDHEHNSLSSAVEVTSKQVESSSRLPRPLHGVIKSPSQGNNSSSALSGDSKSSSRRISSPGVGVKTSNSCGSSLARENNSHSSEQSCNATEDYSCNTPSRPLSSSYEREGGEREDGTFIKSTNNANSSTTTSTRAAPKSTPPSSIKGSATKGPNRRTSLAAQNSPARRTPPKQDVKAKVNGRSTGPVGSKGRVH